MILLSFLAAAISSARRSALQAFSQQNLSLGVKSLFAQYCRPLYEDYHLFLLEGGEQEDRFADEILKYQGKIGSSFYKETDRKVEIKNMTGFCSQNGDIYRYEILEYMKFHLPELLIEKTLKEEKELEKAKNTSEALEKKLEIEENLSQLNVSAIRVMELIEGIQFRNGRMISSRSFVKQICPEEISESAVGINQQKIFNKHKSRYISWQNAGAGKCRELTGIIDEALEAIEKLEEEREKAAFKLENQQTDYFLPKKQGIEEVNQGIKDEYTFLQNYGGKELLEDSVSSRIIGMKGTLLENRQVLERYISASEEMARREAEKRRVREERKKKKKKGEMIPIPEDEEEDRGALQAILKDYKIRSLQFDYSGFIMEEQENPVDNLKKAFGAGILSLVLDDSAVPNQVLPKELSVAQAKKSGSSYGNGNLSDLTTENTKAVRENLHTFCAGQILREGAQDILEAAYYPMHFSNYCSAVKKGNIACETEFIISGGNTEKEALELTLNRFLLERGILNFMYLLTDKEKSGEAQMAAAALVGYTGMEPLIQVVKTAILFAWGMAEAILDITILLQGGKEPLWKTKETFLIRFSELFVFGKELIRKKASEYKALAFNNGNTYEDYLKGFLILEKQENRINRSTALIQKNMKDTYKEDFLLSDGLFGITAQAEYVYGEGKVFQTQISYCY